MLEGFLCNLLISKLKDLNELQDISFFRASIGVILIPAPNSGNFFIKMTRRSSNGLFEKFSKGEGRTIALSLEEISKTLLCIDQNKEFNVYHRAPSGIETRIRFIPQEMQLEIRLDSYAITLNHPEARIFYKLLEKTEDSIIQGVVDKKIYAKKDSEFTKKDLAEYEQPFAQTGNQNQSDIDPKIMKSKDLILNNFQGSWILSKILEKLDSLGITIDQGQLLKSLEILLQEGFIQKEERTAKAGHTYSIFVFPD